MTSLFDKYFPDANEENKEVPASLFDKYFPEDKEVAPKKQELWQGLSTDPTWSGMVKRLGVGALRGVKDVGDTLAHGAGNVAASVAESVLPESLSKPIRQSVEETKAADKAGREEYEKEYGTSRLAGAGRIGGQIVGTLPLMPPGMGTAIESAAGALPSINAAGARVAAPIANRLMGAVGTGAAGGAIVGGATASENDKSTAQNIGEGALTGGIAGPVLSTAGTLAKGAGKAFAGSIDAATAKLAQRAEQLGINLRGAQVSESPILKKYDQMSGQLPFSGAQNLNTNQIDQFYKAVSNTFGKDTPEITERLIKSAKQDIGADMDAIKQRSINPVDRQLANDFHGVLDKAQYMTPDEQRIIQKHIDNVLHQIDANGEISGESLHNLTKHGGALSDAQSNHNPNIAKSANGIRKGLEGLLSRNLSPQDLQAWNEAKAKYKAASTVGEWLERAPGEPHPLRLLRMVKNAPGGEEGGGTLAELGNIARKFFVEPKDSGTPIGTKVLQAIDATIHHPIAALSAGGLAVASGAALTGMATSGAALGANRLAREIVNSKVVKNSLINSALGGTHSGAESALKKAAPYSLPVIRGDEKREPLRITVNPK